MPFKKTDLLHNMASLPLPVPGRYFIADEQETAGAALTFLRDRMLFSDDPPALPCATRRPRTHWPADGLPAELARL